MSKNVPALREGCFLQICPEPQYAVTTPGILIAICREFWFLVHACLVWRRWTREFRHVPRRVFPRIVPRTQFPPCPYMYTFFTWISTSFHLHDTKIHRCWCSQKPSNCFFWVFSWSPSRMTSSPRQNLRQLQRLSRQNNVDQSFIKFCLHSAFRFWLHDISSNFGGVPILLHHPYLYHHIIFCSCAWKKRADVQ